MVYGCNPYQGQFDSGPELHGPVAQWLGQSPYKRQMIGSTPTWPTAVTYGLGRCSHKAFGKGSSPFTATYREEGSARTLLSSPLLEPS